MRFQQFLQEEYYGRSSTQGKAEVFKNPSSKEMKEASESKNYDIRFIAINKEKSVYVWSALQAIHSEIWKNVLKKSNKYYVDAFKGDVLHGVAKQIGGKWTLTSSDILDYSGMSEDEIRALYDKFKWIEKYINIKEYLFSDKDTRRRGLK